MTWEKVALSNLIHKPLTGEWGAGEGNIKVLRTTNFTNTGDVDFTNVVTRNIEASTVIRKKLQPGDIIIEKSGGGPKQPVGRVVYFNAKGDYLCNNFTSILRPIKDVDPKFLFWRLFAAHQQGETLRFQNKTTGIINLKLERYTNELEVPLPPLHIQQQIADTLDKADALRQKDQQSLQKYDELAQSIFYDMFGDPVSNDKNWDILELGQLCESFKYGTNAKSYNEKAENSVPVIRIPNVLDNTVVLSDLKYSVLPEKELKEVLLRKGDLLFVRSNGNPNYIGRCAVYNHMQDFAYASYLIRARLKSKGVILPQFIQSVLSYETYRRTVVKKATTTAGNYNINTVSLKSLPIIIPPLSTQKKYEDVHGQLTKIIQLAKDEQTKGEQLINKLLTKHFNN